LKWRVVSSHPVILDVIRLFESKEIMIRKLFFVILSTSLFIGCSGNSKVLQIELNDSDAGIAATVTVGSDGTFEDEIENGNVVAILKGNVSVAGDGQYEISVDYERKTYTTDSTFKSEKLNCDVTTQVNAEIPIGKNPSQQQPDSSNALEKLSIKLVAPETTKRCTRSRTCVCFSMFRSIVPAR
jgi:hypothetical protein